MTGANVCAVLTPPGAGGIAVLALTGQGVAPVVTSVFRPAGSRREFRSGTIHYGHIVDSEKTPAEVIDEVLVTFFDSSASGTGQPYFEINCHGGTVPVRALTSVLTRRGIQEVSPGEFLRLEVHPGHTELEWRAYELACEAATVPAASHLLAQFQGALSGKLRELRKCLKTDAAKAYGLADELLESAQFASALHNPPAVTIVGRPNVGKSTLFNLLVGSERSLVHHVAGTTRDAVASVASLGGIPVRVVDTAGLRPALNAVEAQGVRISQEKLAAANLVIWVMDHSRKLDDLEGEHLQLLAGKKVIAVVNKMDLPGELPEPSGLGEPVHLCAHSGEGLRELKQRIIRELFGGKIPEIGRALVFDEDLAAWLRGLGERHAQRDRDALIMELGRWLEPSGKGREMT